MRPVQSQTLTAAGNSAPVAMDPRGWLAAIGVELIISGTLTATVQYTLDDIYVANFNPSTANWVDSTITGSATTAGSIAIPVSALRLKVSAFTSGSAYFRAIQGSTDGG